MGPRNAYKGMLDKVVSLIACVNMNHQNELEQMANEATFATLLEELEFYHIISSNPACPLFPFLASHQKLRNTRFIC
jgi:hypothetical protein